MKKFITQIILVPNHIKEPEIFSEGAVQIDLLDEAGGHFLGLSCVGGQPLRLDFDELDAVFAACKELDGQK